MKKYNNKGGFIGVLYNPPIITRRSTIKELVPSSKELVPSPLRKLAKTFAKSKIAKTLKKRILMSKQAKIIKELLNNPICAICLYIIDQNDATLTRCNHVFHTTCLDKWLSTPTSRNTCPSCRQKIRKTSSTSASGLTLSQIEQLRRETQNINPEIQKELIIKLCSLQKSHWILKEKINWVETHYPNFFSTYMLIDAETQEMAEWMNNLEILIKKIIAIYSDVFPDFKHLFQAIYNSRALPYSMTLEDIVNQLQTIVDEAKNIYENDEVIKHNLNIWIDSVVESYADIEDDELLAPFMAIAKTMIDSNN